MAVDRVRVPLPVRATGIAVAIFGVLLIAGSLSAPVTPAGVAFGLVLMLGLSTSFVFAECTPTGVTYRVLRTRQIATGDIASIRVEQRGNGFGTPFPTIVVYRQNDTPVVLRHLQVLDTDRGWTRLTKRAQRWNQILGIS